ncbi:putative methyltransferase-like protein 24 isoform X2 [Saccoglossus kowalevskii]
MLKPPSALLKVPTNYDLKLDDNLTLSQIKETMVKYLHTITYKCQNDTRFGKSGDGGWNICMDVGILPNNCIVYSFGINNDWSFDDAIANYGCNVYAFDPTIGLENHKHSERVWFYNIGLYGDNVNNLKLHGSHWKARTLSSIREMLHHGNKPLTVVYLLILEM